MHNQPNIFAVAPNVREFLMLQETGLELALQQTLSEPLSLNGTAAEHWVPLHVDWLIVPGEENDNLKVPDIATLGATGLAVSQAVADKMQPLLSGACEFLPLKLRGESWYLLNILETQDALDHERSAFRERRGGRKEFTRVVFNPEKISDPRIFRVQGLGASIYSADSPDSFYDIVQRQGLTGLWFRKVNTA